MSADNELDLVFALVLDYIKHLVGIIYDMSLLNADIKALVAKDPKAAVSGRIRKHIAERGDLIGGNIGVLPIDTLTVGTVAGTVGLVVCIKEDKIHVTRAANEGRTDEIRDAIKNVVTEVAEIVISLHNEHGDRAVADDLCHARKMLHIVSTADASVYNVAKTNGKVNALVLEILEQFLQFTERPRRKSVPIRDLLATAMKVGKESNYH